MSLTTEVLIAGAGPVGLALANLLGQYGRRVTLVESRSELIDYPRGVGMDDESFRSLQTMGLIDEVTPFTVPHHVMRLVNGHGEIILTNDPKGEPFGWPRKHGFIQPLVDKVMHDGLARYDNVTVLFSHELVGIDDRGDKVVATVRTGPDDGGTTEIQAAYLVGCEGGRSFTRGWMGVDFEGKSPSTRWVVVDVRNDPLGTPNVYLGADPRGPMSPSACRTASDAGSSCCSTTSRARRSRTMPSWPTAARPRARLVEARCHPPPGVHPPRPDRDRFPQGSRADRRRRRPPDARLDGPGLELRPP